MEPKAILDLLLPEKQIGTIRREHGFFSWPEAADSAGSTASRHSVKTAAPVETDLQVDGAVSEVPAISYVPASKRKRQASDSTREVSRASGHAGGATTTSGHNAAAPSAAPSSMRGRHSKSPSAAPVGGVFMSNAENGSIQHRSISTGQKGGRDKFARVRSAMGATFIGQADYLDALCSSYRRPFVIAPEKGKPRNVVFVIGPKATGRHYSIDLLCEAMSRNGLGKNVTPPRMDLSRYAAPEDFKLFLSDLYSALCSQASTIVLDGFEKAHPTCIEALSSLVQKGRYDLDSRYLLQRDSLMDSSGILAPEAVGSLSSGDKYFVFVSESPESKIADVFGTRFMSSVGDIVRMGDYSSQEVRTFCARELNKLANRCSETMGVSLSPDVALLDYCTALYKPSAGFGEIIEFTEKKLYNALGEYVLTVGQLKNGQVSLGMQNGELSARIDGATISLSAYMRPEYKGNLSEAEAELDAMIGLTSVKEGIRGIRSTCEAGQLRRQSGHSAAKVSLHMIFTGNPGTGKTTVARIVAKYLKALGVLSSGHLREVSRGDLVGQYVGHTASQTRKVIESALGGVLFIDEAYSLCRGDSDTFGLEAIDTLVKCMEDNRDDLVVILAGYTDEMAKFLNSNPGLKSRFPNVIEFPDYTAAEMVEIAESVAKSKGYAIADDCKEGLLALFEKSQVKGRNDSGNGRLARNTVEGAIVRQSKRIVSDRAADLSMLIKGDFDFTDYSKSNLEASLSGIVGLEQVKDFIRTQQKLLVAERKRRDAGYKVDASQTLNMIFAGNPGTGKTTVARIMAQMLKDMGYLKTGQLVETSRSGLVSEYAGGTAKKTEEVFRSALGGVLFIDEAYALSNGAGAFGQEAIDELVKLIEDYRGEVVVILAGYRKEMSEFLKSNSGLESRFPLRIEFPDYTNSELVQIAARIISSKGFFLSEEAEAALPKALGDFARSSQGTAGNGRMARNFAENILRNQSARVASTDVDATGLVTVEAADLTSAQAANPGFELEKELAKVIGMEEVKQFVRSLQARLRMESERTKIGLPSSGKQTLHMVFTGNPGTGKTMMARTIAKTLAQLGVIQSDKLVETDRAGLVAGYVGQTAIKTTEKFNEALGGVLFIDEAYSLSGGGDNDFGREAIDTLVKLMDDYRDRVVVILAGYTKEMEGFLGTNPGLKSRFPNVIEFADYSVDDLVKISASFYAAGGYIVTDEALSKMRGIFKRARTMPGFGNGRYARNLFERSLNNQAMRLSSDPDLTREELTTIEASDIEEV